jgi:DNA repair photolyase
MRWDEQAVDREQAPTLPGFPDSVVRTFDAPEAMGINFHEVRAKSALNHVPGAPYGFEYTVNVYRGCSHACSYCVDGDTPILMADGRTKLIRDVRAGDLIYGSVPYGSYRRYVITNVLDHWTTRKQAHRITLEDGTEILASGDHRFLTDRGWKYVTGTEQGHTRRPFLTLNNKLMGVGGLPTALPESPEYRRGYLCGIVRGDGHIGSYSYDRPGRRNGDVHRFRLALTDTEALERARLYLVDAGVPTGEFQFQKETETQRPIPAIRTSAREHVARIKALIQWPDSASYEWSRGFLAGIFDAEGSNARGIVRICNTDPHIIANTVSCLRTLGHDSVIEDRHLPNGLRVVRLRGGLRAQLRLFQAIDPAITRKRAIAGTALKSNARLGVVAIEPLNRRGQMFDITTGTGDFIANGVVSHNCFARRTHTYLDLDAGSDFEREIVVKVNAPEVLRAELARPSWNGDLVAMGTNTDPYQWVESRYRLTREVLGALRDFDTPVSVLTKSPLALRDLDLYKELAERVDVSVSFSVPTLDQEAWRATEPHTPHPRARLEAMAEFRRNGIRSGVMVAPLMPGINDSPGQVEPILKRAREADATFIGSSALHLRGEVKDVFFGWLRNKRPDLVSRYEELYARGAYLPPAERKRLTALVGSSGRRRRRAAGGAEDGSPPGSNRTTGGSLPQQDPRPERPRPKRPRPERQPKLF